MGSALLRVRQGVRGGWFVCKLFWPTEKSSKGKVLLCQRRWMVEILLLEETVSVDQEETWEGHWKDGTLAKLNEFLGLQSKVTKRRLQIFFT